MLLKIHVNHFYCIETAAGLGSSRVDFEYAITQTFCTTVICDRDSNNDKNFF